MPVAVRFVEAHQGLGPPQGYHRTESDRSLGRIVDRAT